MKSVKSFLPRNAIQKYSQQANECIGSGHLNWNKEEHIRLNDALIPGLPLANTGRVCSTGVFQTWSVVLKSFGPCACIKEMETLDSDLFPMFDMRRNQGCKKPGVSPYSNTLIRLVTTNCSAFKVKAKIIIIPFGYLQTSTCLAKKLGRRATFQKVTIAFTVTSPTPFVLVRETYGDW